VRSELQPSARRSLAFEARRLATIRAKRRLISLVAVVIVALSVGAVTVFHIKNSCNSHLRGANLSGCDLSHANLAGKNLSGANLHGPDLAGVNLSGALLDHVTSGSITGTPAALPTEWELVNGYLIGPNANLTKADWLMPTSVKQSSLEQTSPRPTSPRPTSPRPTSPTLA
jgi:hypothetical protein